MPACGGCIAPSGKGLCAGADGMGQTTGNTGVSWRQVLPVAGCLGLVEFGLMVAPLRFPAQVSPAWAIPVGELLYLLLPAAAAHIPHLPVRTFSNFSESDKPRPFLPRRPFQSVGFGLRETATRRIDFPLGRLESPHSFPKYQGLGEQGM